MEWVVHQLYMMEGGWGAQEMVLLGLCGLLVAVAALLGLRRAFLRKAQVSYPPGPPALPLVGHLHLLGSLPHHSFSSLSITYGPLLFLRLGSRPAIVVSSPSFAKLILHTHDNIFSGRSRDFTVLRNSFASPDFRDIGFSLPSPFWKFLRHLCFADFFSPKALHNFQPLRSQEVRSLLLSVYAAQGTAFTIREKLQRTVLNLTARMAVSKSLQEIADEMPRSSEGAVPALLELIDMLGEFNVSDYMPWLAWMDVQGYDRRSKRAASITRAFFQEVIDRRRAERCSTDNKVPPPDFLDVLLLASVDPKNKHLQIDDNDIRAVLLDMFAAGTDTTTVMVEWALAELMSNPQTLNTLQEELDKIVGCSRLVQENDLPNLPYLQAVVNETLRLHPPAPFLVPHISMEPSQIEGYQIPKNCLVYVNVWAIHRDPTIWNNPLTFSPERFLGSNTNELARQFSFFPFGSGRRMCPGASLGILNVQNILANLVHTFHCQTLGKPKLKEKFGLTVILDEPLVIVPKPRLPKALLEISA